MRKTKSKKMATKQPKWPKDILVRVRVVGKSIELATKTADIIDGKLYPAGGPRIGVVVINTRKHLGIEKTAIPILKRLFSESHLELGDLHAQDSMSYEGDIQWWKAGKDFCFGWLGPNKVRWRIDSFSQACRTGDDAFRPGEFVTL